MYLQTFSFIKGLKIPKAFSKPSQTSKVQTFAEIVNSKQPLTIFAKSNILDVRMGSEYASTSSFPGMFNILLGKEVS